MTVRSTRDYYSVRIIILYIILFALFDYLLTVTGSLSRPCLRHILYRNTRTSCAYFMTIMVEMCHRCPVTSTMFHDHRHAFIWIVYPVCASNYVLILLGYLSELTS